METRGTPEDYAFTLLIRSHTTPSESSFGEHCIAIFTKSYLLEIAGLRKEFLAFKEKHPQIHEWTFWTAHTDFYPSATGALAPVDPEHPWRKFLDGDEDPEAEIDFSDILQLAAYKDKEDHDVEPQYVKMPDAFNVASEPDRTEMDMMILDENGIQFSCYVDDGDDYTKTVEIPYSFLFEGLL